MVEKDIETKVIPLAIQAHSVLGPALLERAYKECLQYSLVKSGLVVLKEKPIPLIFEKVKLECGYRVDLLVEHSLVIEVKSVEALNDLYLAQTHTYLKLGNHKLGLLIHFNSVCLKDSLRRVINGYL